MIRALLQAVVDGKGGLEWGEPKGGKTGSWIQVASPPGGQEGTNVRDGSELIWI